MNISFGKSSLQNAHKIYRRLSNSRFTDIMRGSSSFRSMSIQVLFSTTTSFTTTTITTNPRLFNFRLFSFTDKSRFISTPKGKYLNLMKPAACNRFYATRTSGFIDSNTLSPHKQSALGTKIRKKVAIPRPDEESGAAEVVAYAVSEEIYLEKLDLFLANQKLYEKLPLPSDAEDVIHAQAVYEVDRGCREVFFFREGAVIFWNMSYMERKEILQQVRKFCTTPYDLMLTLNENESLNFTYTDNQQTNIKGYEIQFSMSDTHVLEKYAFSNALGLSVKLSLWEESLNQFVESIEPLIDDLRCGRKIRISREDLLRKTGQLFTLRHLVNLSSDLLDTPDFYWDREGLEPLYQKTLNYLNVAKRTRVKEQEAPKNFKKYTVRPPKDLTSKFEKKQVARKIAEEEKAIKNKLLAEEEAELARAPKPTDDPLYGMRVHSWILVEAGKREVPESFFIEPFTGLPQPLLNEKYLGIESVWNHQNYWANMQDCSKGVMEMSYDLGDCAKWEYMFPTNEKAVLLLPDEDIDMDFEDEADNNTEIEKHLDMPRSWVEPLQISLNDFQMRYPGGKKTIYYKKAKLEKFALYLMPDGLVNRVSVYEDTSLTNLIQVNEYFLNRTDRLHTREYDHRKCWVHEYFHEGRPRSLKEHMYKFNSTSPESERTMIFYHHARVDGLETRTETPTEMTEHFVDREDFLFYRYTEFGRRQLVFAPQNVPDTMNDRPIISIVEKFHRNPKKAANDDVFMRTLTENKISIVYHTDDKCITYSTCEFLKSPTWTDKNAPNIGWNPELHTAFQVGPSASINKEVDLYQFLRLMLNEEVQSREAVRNSELEVKAILDGRLIEEAACSLDVSVYDTQRNEKARARREKMKEKQELEERLKREAMEVDYLAPFLAQISDPEQLTKLEASTVQKACLEDLRHRLLEKANLIQKRFEKETSELLKKQEWYQKNQISMQKEDEDEYSQYVEAALFRIHILEVRLNRHKEMATQKYKALERKLRNDPRLSELFN